MLEEDDSDLLQDIFGEDKEKKDKDDNPTKKVSCWQQLSLVTCSAKCLLRARMTLKLRKETRKKRYVVAPVIPIL